MSGNAVPNGQLQIIVLFFLFFYRYLKVQKYKETTKKTHILLGKTAADGAAKGRRKKACLNSV
jgi:hypothetical protein